MRGDLLEIFLQFFNRLGIEFKQALAAHMYAAHDFRPLEHSQMLGDGLSCKPGAARELRHRMWPPAAKPRNQCQPSLVAQGGKDGCRSPKPGCHAATVFARHSSRYS